MFDLKNNGTKPGTDNVAGLTTFFTMVYIVVVNPMILSATGMDGKGVFVATILAAIVGTLVMGLFANVPYAQAPGMGLNAFFTYTICFGFGFTWREALAMVFICGLINVLITVTKVRKSIIKSIPRSLQNAIGGGIGLFIAYIGLKNAGLIEFAATTEGLTPGAAAVPQLATFNNPAVILSVIAIVIMIVLVSLKVKGGLFIGILATTLIGALMGIVTLPEGFKWFDIEGIGAVKNTAFAFFGSDGLGSMFTSGSKIVLVIISVFAFCLSDTFDTIGTFIGTGRVSGIFDDKDEQALMNGTGFKSKMDKALFADATATSVGALFGTSNTTTYVESAAGIAAGGRTGLTSVVVAVMFALCLPFSHVFGLVPAQATSAALIIVGILMAGSFKDVEWDKFEFAAPAFFTVAIMAFAYNISYGIAAGFIIYCLIKICTGKIKEIHPILAGASILFIINFVILALNSIGLLG